jgi:hypothetical protein
MNNPASSPSVRASIQINLSDGPACEIWIKKISEALRPETRVLDVLFLSGGSKIEPSALIALRNALLRIPDAVFVRTVAMSSLSPFACVAWLVGDERWIAADARVWIPQLPEPILRGHPTGAAHNPELTRVPEPTGDGNEAEESSDDSDEVERMINHLSGSATGLGESHRADIEETECGCRRCRQATELRTLSSAVNAWFPSWEYAGVGLDVADLVDLRIISPEWIFGGNTTRRGKARHVDPADTAESATRKQTAESKSTEANPEPDAAPKPDAPPDEAAAASQTDRAA